MNPARALLEAIDALPPMPNTFNPWSIRAGIGHGCNADDTAANGPRRRREHLEAHFGRAGARVVLCGEAPGYHGARISGLAFTSEGLLLDGAIPGITLTERLSTRPSPWRESSARAVWKVLYAHGAERSVRLFNAFPFHPHKPGQPLSNRTPTAAELRAGQPVLIALYKALPNVRFVAVGQSAQRSLTAIGIEHVTIRHPAYGGETEFAAGLAKILQGKS